jgi:hypothetical protein
MAWSCSCRFLSSRIEFEGSGGVQTGLVGELALNWRFVSSEDYLRAITWAAA